MAKLPDYVQTSLSDAEGEIRRFSMLVDQYYAKHKNPNSAESQVFYSLVTICKDLHACVEGLVDAVEGKK